MDIKRIFRNCKLNLFIFVFSAALVVANLQPEVDFIDQIYNNFLVGVGVYSFILNILLMFGIYCISMPSIDRLIPQNPYEIAKKHNVVKTSNKKKTFDDIDYF